MNGSSANCPEWLADRIVKSGGCISFYQYMDWALNDDEHGAYSSGRLRLGPKGDFTTSPSMGTDFAELLAKQLVEWFEQLQQRNVYNFPLSLIEVGPGEGDLAFDLIKALDRICPVIIKKIELVLVDINQGMVQRQKNRFNSVSNIPVRWVSLDQLAQEPLVGIILAHEILDTLPVERIIFRGNKLFRQGVKLEEFNSNPVISFCDLPLSHNLKSSLLEIKNDIGIKIPPDHSSEGWSGEVHVNINPWFKKVSEILIYGSLLIIDYALEAARYYNSSRSSGTIISYKNQYASSNVLIDPGYCDITSHLCLETLLFYAERNKWLFIGQSKQGEALLSLGLAERLYSLQLLPPSQLDIALSRRESLLRLVDPTCLGEFRWLAFEIDNQSNYSQSNIGLRTQFLNPPSD